MFDLLKNFWTGNIVQEAPAEFAQCEFGCRATVCHQSQWEICKSQAPGGAARGGLRSRSARRLRRARSRKADCAARSRAPT